MRYPGTRGLIGRSKLKTLKETTLKSLWEVCRMQGLKPEKHYKYNQQSGTITFFNGSEILLKDLFSYPSDPNFDELGSLEITDAFIDEANQVSSKAKQIVRSRIRLKLDENNLLPKMLMTCNPAKNWVYTEFFKPAQNNTLDHDKAFIQSLVTDNPFISNTYYDNLKRLDNNTKQRLLFGNWDYDDDPSLLVDYDSVLDMFTNDHAKQDGRFISSDLAMQGRDKFIAGYWEGLVCYVMIDKDRNNAKDIETDLTHLKIAKEVPNSHIVADSDGLGQYLSSYIENIYTFHGGSSAIHKDQYFNLKSECGFKLAELINNRKIRVVCSKEQQESIIQEIITCLKRDNIYNDTMKKKLITKDIMKEYLGHSPDYMDMLLMRMVYELMPVRTTSIMDDDAII